MSWNFPPTKNSNTMESDKDPQNSTQTRETKQTPSPIDPSVLQYAQNLRSTDPIEDYNFLMAHGEVIL